MRKLLGCVLVLGCCLWWVWNRTHALRREAETLEALARTLGHMALELERCAPEMETLLSLDLQSDSEVVRQFFQDISLKSLRERSFETLWREAVQGSDLPDRGKRFLLPLGTVLGRYDRTAQAAALSAAQADLQAAGAAVRKTLSDNRRLWYTLSLSAGLMVVLLLL